MADNLPRPMTVREMSRMVGKAHRETSGHTGGGGFAGNPQLARRAGRKGGEAVKKKYGVAHYEKIGKMGGQRVKETRGPDYYATIGRLGGRKRGSTMKARKSAEEKK